MKLHLVDATFELFRAYYSRPPRRAPDGRPVNAVQGLVDSMLSLLREPDVTHIGAATDHVIESWRNDLFLGYKSSAGVDPDLLSQFGDAERALEALGMPVWAMVEDEADDAIAAAVDRFGADPTVEQVIICSVDKDLGQLVDGSRIVLRDRMRRVTYDEAGIVGKFGVAPDQHPRLPCPGRRQQRRLPGLPGWGAKSAAAVLARWKHLEAIPASALDWEVPSETRRGWPPRWTSNARRRSSIAALPPSTATPTSAGRHPGGPRLARRPARAVRRPVRGARLRYGPRAGPPLGRLAAASSPTSPPRRSPVGEAGTFGGVRWGWGHR